jgi:hypothetical protein
VAAAAGVIAHVTKAADDDVVMAKESAMAYASNTAT